MSDLKVIILFVIFSVLFGGVMVLIGQTVSTGGEYIDPSNTTYDQPSAGAFTALQDGLSLNTGVWIIDNWVVTIIGAIIVFLIYRALRGQ